MHPLSWRAGWGQTLATQNFPHAAEWSMPFISSFLRYPTACRQTSFLNQQSLPKRVYLAYLQQWTLTSQSSFWQCCNIRLVTPKPIAPPCALRAYYFIMCPCVFYRFICLNLPLILFLVTAIRESLPDAVSHPSTVRSRQYCLDPSLARGWLVISKKDSHSNKQD